MNLPTGFAVRLDPAVASGVRCGLLVGGSPLTVTRLSDRARNMLADGTLTVTDRASRQLAQQLLRSNLAHPDTARLSPVSHGDLTVVIPVRDRTLQLDALLSSLRGLRCVVVDDASVDPAAIAAVCARHDAALVRLAINVGPAAARNHGQRRVTTPFTAYVDSDVHVDVAGLLDLTRHFVDPDVVAVGPQILGCSGPGSRRWFERYDERCSSLSLGAQPGRVSPGTRIGWLPSACLVVRTSSLGRGFDPALRVGEDVDLVWRMVGSGKVVRYDPGVVVRHDSRTRFSSWVGRTFDYGTSAAPLASRHGSAVAPAILDPMLAAAGAALLLRSRGSPGVAAAALAVTTHRVRGSLPAAPRRTVLATRLTACSLGWAVRQESALLVRHGWPAAVAAALVSPRARRAVTTALVVDACVALARHHDAAVPPATVVAGNLTNGLAYGAGVWWGCWRERSVRALLPRRPRR